MTQRIRKAWEVSTTWSREQNEWDWIWAETASKARYAFMLVIGDCYDDIEFSDIHVRRAKHHDLVLPGEHRLVSELSAEDRVIILHAFAADHKREPGYRNHYCTQPGDSRLHRLAWELGLFSGPHGQEDGYGEVKNWCGVFYYLTDLGKHVALSMMPTYGRIS